MNMIRSRNTCLLFSSIIIATTTHAEPLPGIRLPSGSIQDLSLGFIRQVLGKAVELGGDYLADYSHAAFQLELAKWSEAKAFY